MIVFVTHDERMVERCTRVIRLRDGYLDRDEPGAAAGRRAEALKAMAKAA